MRKLIYITILITIGFFFVGCCNDKPKTQTKPSVVFVDKEYDIAGSAPLSVSLMGDFTNKTSNSNLTYKWYINNQLIKNGVTFNYVFNNAGEYAINLKVFNKGDLLSTKKLTVKVNKLKGDALVFGKISSNINQKSPDEMIKQARILLSHNHLKEAKELFEQAKLECESLLLRGKTHKSRVGNIRKIRYINAILNQIKRVENE